MFSDFIDHFTPCQIFPSLTELRVFFLRCLPDDVAKFIMAHSSTLTNLSIKRSDQSYIPEDYRKLFHTVLPNLNRLKLLDTDWKNYLSVRYI
jgi:hypothetical protein